MPGARSRAPPLLLLLLSLVARSSSAPTSLFSIHPTGGPIRGGTSLTLRGEHLGGASCIFGSDGFFGYNLISTATETIEEPALVSVICDSSSYALCTCTTPAALTVSGGLTEKSGRTIVQAQGPDGMAASRFEVRAPAPRVALRWPLPQPPPPRPQVHFTYFEYNAAVKVTAIRPSVGHPERHTLVTISGNGFVDYGGPWCSFPGAFWAHDLDETRPEFAWTHYLSEATMLDSETMLCVLPPQGNNTNPVFVRARASRRRRLSRLSRLSPPKPA